MKNRVLTRRPTLTDNTPTATPEAAATAKRLSDMHGKAIVVQNIDGNGETAIGFDPVTKKLHYYDAGQWKPL